MTTAAVRSAPTASALRVPAAPMMWYEQLDVAGAAAADRSRRDTPQRRSDGWLDVAGLGAAGPVLIASTLHTIVGAERDPTRLADEWAFYAQPRLLGASPESPELFVQPPPLPDPVPLLSGRNHGLWEPPDGTLSPLVFPSAFTPFNAAAAQRYPNPPANRRLPVWWWRHSGDPRPTVVCVHGMMMGRPKLNAAVFGIRWLYEQGFDVVLPTLPFHGTRKILFQGLHYPSGDVTRLAEATAHAVSDLRAVIGWLRRCGAPSVGVLGSSLGSYLAAALATVDPDLAFVAATIPVVSLFDACHSWWVTGPSMRRSLRRLGWTLDDARRHAACHTPLQFPARVGRDRLLILAAHDDRLMGGFHADLLSQHWGASTLRWRRGSHLYERDVPLRRRLLAELLELATSPPAPSSGERSG